MAQVMLPLNQVYKGVANPTEQHKGPCPFRIRYAELTLGYPALYD